MQTRLVSAACATPGLVARAFAAERRRAFGQHHKGRPIEPSNLRLFDLVNSRTAALPPPRSRHFAAITDPEQLGQLLRDIQGYKGNVITRAALQLSPLLFQRPGQLRLAHWEDVDLDQSLWRCRPRK